MKLFLNKHKQIDAKIFDRDEKVASISAAFIDKYGEDIWRDLEACFISDIVGNYNLNNKGLDIRGKAFLHKHTQKLLKEKFITIFLYADDSTVMEHLATNDNWKKRGNYRLAEEKEVRGWRKLAMSHRNDRMSDMVEHSKIIIDIAIYLLKI